VTARRSLAERLEGPAFQAYVYSYPHKTTYRTIEPAVPLCQAWAEEDRSALFLYVHVPFCEQRCGFCNLFTQSRPPVATVERYLDALERQAAVVANQIEPRGFARMAVGGGTPTCLEPEQLRRLFRVAGDLGSRGAPCSVELSPATADEDRLGVLREVGVSRVSVGVQSVHENETAALKRRQVSAEAAAAVSRLRDWGFPTVNVDLIYGQAGQTAASFVASIDEAVAWGADEIYLYPLYVRPYTTLGRFGVGPVPEQLELYRAGRDRLLQKGWRQRSLRLFRAPDTNTAAGPVYRCQEDGMIGLGPGARSYTRRLHYATRYAVDQASIRSIIDAWSAQSEDEMGLIRNGFTLDGEDERRRYALLSLLDEGLDDAGYRRRFGASALHDLPELGEAVALGLVVLDCNRWQLSEAGVEKADIIGAWLFSAKAETLMANWVAP
jgi:oxygen-independent coproporphyrinogen-3 oxidase